MPQNNQTLLEKTVADPALRTDRYRAAHAGLFQHPCHFCYPLWLH